MRGQKSVDTQMKVSADEVWAAYRGLEAAKIGNKILKDLGHTDVIQGDGGVGTIVKMTFPPGTPGASYMKERFLIMDDVHRIKETEVFEGGIKALGFDSYHLRFEIYPIDANSSFVRSIIKYEMDDSKASLAAYVKTDRLQYAAQAFGKYLYDKKHGHQN